MKTKIFTLIVMLLGFYTQAFSFNSLLSKQDTLKKIYLNTDAFILGTLSEDIARFQYIDKETQIDRYKPLEKSISKYISFFIKKNYKLDSEIKNSNAFIELYSPQLATKLNKYYSDQGVLKYELLDTKYKKLSYLLGVYYRYGIKLDDDFYQITLVGSTKNDAIYRILKDLGTEIVVYKTASEKLPRNDHFYFLANIDMKKYFKILDQEKAQLQFDYMNDLEVNQLLNDSNSKKKTKKDKMQIKITKELLQDL